MSQCGVSCIYLCMHRSMASKALKCSRKKPTDDFHVSATFEHYRSMHACSRPWLRLYSDPPDPPAPEMPSKVPHTHKHECMRRSMASTALWVSPPNLQMAGKTGAQDDLTGAGGYLRFLKSVNCSQDGSSIRCLFFYRERT